MSIKYGRAIKTRRRMLGMNAETLAEKVGISPATIYRYEKDEITSIPYDTLSAITKVLGMTVEEFIKFSSEIDMASKGIATYTPYTKRDTPAPSASPTSFQSAISNLAALAQNAEVVTSEERELLNTFRALTPKQRTKFFRYLDMVVDE